MSSIRNTTVSTDQLPVEIETVVEIDKKGYIFIATYNPGETMFTDQSGKFAHASSQGNNHQMVVHDIDDNSTWVKLMKNRTEGEIIYATTRYRAEVPSARQ